MTTSGETVPAGNGALPPADGNGEAPPVDGNAAPCNSPRFPTRLHFAALAGLFLALAVYGSLVPLRYKSSSWADAVAKFKALGDQPLATFSRTDIAVNVLLFVPIGFCGLAVLVDRRRGAMRLFVSVLAIVIFCSLASVAIEFAQIWFHRRTPSLLDVGAQMVGTLIGIVLWVTVGRSTTDWLREQSLGQGTRTYVGWLLWAYFAGLILFTLLPFELSIQPEELFRKFKQGRVVFRPFSESHGVQRWLDAVSHTAALVPVGMLATIALTSAARPIRSRINSIFLGVLLVVALVAAELLVVPKTSTATDLITGTIGVAIGVEIMRRWLGARTAPTEGAGNFWALVGGGVIYALFLVAFFCAPEREGKPIITSSKTIRTRLADYWQPPFYKLYRGSIFNAVKEVVRKAGLFFPLGLLAGLALRSLRAPRNLRWLFAGSVATAIVAVAVGIEIIQAFVPGHVPDLTDTLLYLTGATAGFLFGRHRWESGSEEKRMKAEG